ASDRRRELTGCRRSLSSAGEAEALEEGPHLAKRPSSPELRQVAARIPVDPRPLPVVPEGVRVRGRADAIAEGADHESSLARHERRAEQRRVHLPELAEEAERDAVRLDFLSAEAMDRLSPDQIGER